MQQSPSHGAELHGPPSRCCSLRCPPTSPALDALHSCWHIPTQVHTAILHFSALPSAEEPCSTASFPCPEPEIPHSLMNTEQHCRNFIYFCSIYGLYEEPRTPRRRGGTFHPGLPAPNAALWLSAVCTMGFCLGGEEGCIERVLHQQQCLRQLQLSAGRWGMMEVGHGDHPAWRRSDFMYSTRAELNGWRWC